MRSFSDVIGRWKNAEELAADVGEAGVTVRAWRNRNSIPAQQWQAVVRAAESRGFEGVTLDLFAKLAAHGGTLPQEVAA